MINKREEKNIKEGMVMKGGRNHKPTGNRGNRHEPPKPQGNKKKEGKKIGGEEKVVVMNEYHFIRGLREDKLSNYTIVIIVDDDTGEILGKVKVLPMKEEEVLVQRTYTIRGYKKEEM